MAKTYELEIQAQSSVYEPKESLYLKSDEYKIGENLINENEEND